MTGSVLDNPAWESLTGAHASYADAFGRARRYHPDVSVFSAVDELDRGSWRDLAALTAGDTAILVAPATPTSPPGWTTVFVAEAQQMWAPDRLADVAERPGVDADTGAAVAVRDLTPDDVDELAALVALTEPGPFRRRTIELGGYVGIFHDGVLVAAAGRRMHPPGHREVSAVCTHPEARRRGYASVLTARVAAAIAASGEIPFLHVASSNGPAIALYDKLGFVTRRTMWFAVLRAPGVSGALPPRSRP